MSAIGILAYGSLIRDPGIEIVPLIENRIRTETPFPVEYARLSNSRGSGPTVVPHTSGKPVAAELLVLKERASLVEAQDLLWRREVRKEGSGRRYSPGKGPNKVLVKDWPGYQGVAHVLYTDFPDVGKIATPDAQLLAQAAIASVAKAEVGNDGVSYLLQLLQSRVKTSLTDQYASEILHRTGTFSLDEALQSLRSKIESA